MMKAIFGRDVRVGYTIVVRDGFRGKVLEELFKTSGGRRFLLDSGSVEILSGDIVGLEVRPQPEETTEADVLNFVFERMKLVFYARMDQSASHTRSLRRAISKLHEATEVYELCRPVFESSGQATRTT